MVEIDRFVPDPHAARITPADQRDRGGVVSVTGWIDVVAGVLHEGCTRCTEWDALDRERAAAGSAAPERTIREDESSMRCVLCLACGLVVVGGHTRWRLLLREVCKESCRSFNQRWGTAIPIGIHSMVNGNAASVTGVRDGPNANRRFRNDVVCSAKTGDALRSYGASLVRTRCKEFGVADGQRAEIGRYMAGCTRAGLTSEQGWATFVGAWFGDVAPEE